MNDQKALSAHLEEKFQRLASKRKQALDVPDEIGESILETLEEVENEEDLTINHGDDAALSSGFINFLNEPPMEGSTKKK
jgi:hypothetical protein